MTEDKIEQSLLDTLAQMGWDIVNGPTIGPDGTMEREYTDVVLERRLDIALRRLNPDLQPAQRDEVIKRVVRTGGVDLLAVLNQIEADFGRERTFRNAPRTLDLDIIDYNHQSSDNPHLTLPHPRAHERSFVMKPLAEILPHFELGQYGNAADIAAQLGDDGIRLLNEEKQ